MREKKKNRKNFISQVKYSFVHDWQLYLLILPTLIYLIIFSYVPMYGIQIAFKDYNPSRGFANSPWIGFKYFTDFFGNFQFKTVMLNTIYLGFYNLIAGFFPPIILAILLHNTLNKKFKSIVQTISYAPHFISMVVMVGMVLLILSPSSGIINTIIGMLGGKKVNFMMIPAAFPHVYVLSAIWQGMGWGSIIYLSALAGADPELYEAAKVDGANKLQRIWHLDIPTLMPTAIIMLIMNCGYIISSDTQKILLLQNNVNLSTSEVIGTMVHKTGIVNLQYGYSTAVGLFQNLVNIIMLVTVNKIAGKVSETSLW